MCPCTPSPRAQPCPQAPHPPTQLCRYLQCMVYGSSVGDQLVKCGRIEMLPKGHEPHQLVCRNLGESEKSLRAGMSMGTGMPCFSRVPHSTMSPTAPAADQPRSAAVPSMALTPRCWAMAMRHCRALSGLCSHTGTLSAGCAEGDMQQREQQRQQHHCTCVEDGCFAPSAGTTRLPAQTPSTAQTPAQHRHPARCFPHSACSPGEVRDGRAVTGSGRVCLISPEDQRLDKTLRRGRADIPSAGSCHQLTVASH